jgi:hypothetical protein
MVLYAKSLGASATVLGVIAGMLPLLVVFQIPAARFIASVGYKRFVLSGWGVRVFFIFLIALVPMTHPIITSENQLALVVSLLFLFNLSRGISSCAWLPWITSLFPAEQRGSFLRREAVAINLASLVSFVTAAWVLGAAPTPPRFAAAFALSALAGAASLGFLRRVPDVTAPGELATVSSPVPVRTILGEKTFRRLLAFNAAWSMASGGLLTFAVAYLKGFAALDDDLILRLSAVVFLGGLGSMLALGSVLDRTPARTVLTVTLAGWVVLLVTWCAHAGGQVPGGAAAVAALMFALGVGNTVVNQSTTRLAMALVPDTGRSHYFAVYSVTGSVVLGLAPIGWGLLVDSLSALDSTWHGVAVNRFTVLFACLALAFAVAAALSRRLHEPVPAPGAPLDEALTEALAKPHRRVWVRLWPRP